MLLIPYTNDYRWLSLPYHLYTYMYAYICTYVESTWITVTLTPWDQPLQVLVS